MTLATFKSDTETAWEALSPTDDGTSDAYDFVDDLVEERGGGLHRQLIWGPIDSASIQSQTQTQNLYELECYLFLRRNDRTLAAFRTACEEEAIDLQLEQEGISYSAGVFDPVLEGWSVEEVDPPSVSRSGGVPRVETARIIFKFNVLCQEGGS